MKGGIVILRGNFNKLPLNNLSGLSSADGISASKTE